MIIKRKQTVRKSDRIKSPASDPGLVVVGTNDINQFHSVIKNEFEFEKEKILNYRRISCSTYVNSAIDDIVNEAIGPNNAGKKITLDLNQLELSSVVKSKILEEWERILTLTSADKTLQRDFRKWYVDGKGFWFLVPHDKITDGIKEVRKLDSRFISKITKVSYDTARSFEDNLTTYKAQESFVFFPPTEMDYKNTYSWARNYVGVNTEIIELDPKLCVYQDSGIFNEYDESISYLEWVVKPLNQISMQEDSLVIYRLVKAPERRAWYVDVGGIPKGNAEAYIKNLIDKQKTSIGYNSTTGGLTTSTDVRSMMDDIWLPVRSDGRGTKVETLPGGQNLGEIEDITHFLKKLYNAMKVPVSRIQSEGSFSLGRGAEITRDEVKFYNFVQSLISEHSNMYKELLGVQLVLRQIMTLQEWNSFKDKCFISYSGNSFFAELKQLDILTERLNVIDRLQPYVEAGYVSGNQVKNILKLDEDDSESAKDTSVLKVANIDDEEDLSESDFEENDDTDENNETNGIE